MKWSACVSCSLAAGLGGLGLLVAPSPSSAGPEVSAVPAGSVVARPIADVDRIPWVPEDRAGIAAGAGTACHYQNFDLNFPQPTSQKDPTGKVYAEAADDFILTDPFDPDGLNGCVLDEVTFAVTTMNGTPPDKLFNGVKITIYQDRGDVCLGQMLDSPCGMIPDKGPAGYPMPVADGTRQHIPCCAGPTKEAIVCELKVPMSNVSFVPLAFPDSYEITVFGLDQYNCVLEKNKKYWIAPAPEAPIGVDQIRLWTSGVQIGHEGQAVDVTGQVGTPAWEPFNSPGNGPDLFLVISAHKAPSDQPCQYWNLRVGEGGVAGQKATDFPFYAETADDFVLTDPGDPDGQNPCLLDSVTFAALHGLAGTDPSVWEGLKITIYQDRGNVCARQMLADECSLNPDKGPGGYPVATTDPDVRDHEPCCPDPTKEAIVCELKVPMSQVAFVPLPHPVLTDLYEVTAFGLDQFGCELEKNKKYWIAPAPVLQFGPFDQTFLLTSPNPMGHEAQHFFPESIFPTDSWTQIQTQLGAVDPDLYLAVSATKESTCPWDCANNNGVVGIEEFLEVLGRWGVSPGNPCDFDGDGVIGIDEFLKVLGVWGPCP